MILVHIGDTKEWELKPRNCRDIHLVDNNFLKKSIRDNIRDIVGVMQKEKFVRQTVLKRATI